MESCLMEHVFDKFARGEPPPGDALALRALPDLAAWLLRR